MDLQQLQEFIVVAESGSLTRAAESLFVSQSSLSRKIQALERELGTHLFIRERGIRQITLTDAGQLLLSCARTILSELEHTRSLIDQANRGTVGMVKLAAPPLALRYFVAPALLDFMAAAPAIRLQIIEADYDDGLSLVEKKAVDFAITIPLPASKNLKWELLYTAYVYALLSPAHPWATRPYLTAEELAAEPLLLFKAGHSTALVFELIHHVAGFHPRSAFESSNPETLLMLAQGGHGVAILTDTVPYDGFELVPIPVIHENQQLKTNLIIAWHPLGWLGQAAQRLKGFLEERAAQRACNGYVPWHKGTS